MPSSPQYDIHQCLAQIRAGDSLYPGLAAWADLVRHWAEFDDKDRAKLLPQELAAFDALNLWVVARNGFYDLLTDGNGLNQFFRGHRALQIINYEAGVRVTAPVHALLERLGIPGNGNRDPGNIYDLPAKFKWQQRLWEEARKAEQADPGRYSPDHPYNPRLDVTDPDDFGACSARLQFLLWPSHQPWREVEWGIFAAVAAYLEANASLLKCRCK